MEAHYYALLSTQPKSLWMSLAQFQADRPEGRAAKLLLEDYFENHRQAFTEHAATAQR